MSGIEVVAEAGDGYVVKGKGLRVTKSDPDQHLPTSVQKSYFMLSRSMRAVLDTALESIALDGPT
jgi:hypothetical protein